MKIVAHMVVRNEVGRYLRPCLEWLSTMVDRVYVWDDRSVDGTVHVAADYGEVAVRSLDAPGFLDDESAFRQAGWQWMSELGHLRLGDWVLSIDADEFLVGNGERSVRELLERAAFGGLPVTFNVAEIFGVREGRPLVRTDGFWGSIQARRFVPWTPQHVEFVPRAEGGGSVPRMMAEMPHACSDALTLLHFGYAEAIDRQTKYERYSQGKGHNKMHVESILGPAKTFAWAGQLPEVEW